MDTEMILMERLKEQASELILEKKIRLKDKLIRLLIDRGISRRLSVEIGSLINITGVAEPTNKLLNEVVDISYSIILDLANKGYSEREIIIILKNSFLS